MTVGYYIIPIAPPPYGPGNGERPLYVDAIRCNWTGQPFRSLGVYICKLNTTDAKHADLEAQTGVRRLPDWNMPLSDLPPGKLNALANWCAGHDIAFDATETVGSFILRVVNLLGFGIRGVAGTATVGSLTQTRRDRIANLLAKWGKAYSDTETVSSLLPRCAPGRWRLNECQVEEF